MSHKLEIGFMQSTGLISKGIRYVSSKLNKQQTNFVPSHVFIILDNEIIFESSTGTKERAENERDLGKGTRLFDAPLLDYSKQKDVRLKKCLITNNCDAYLALKFVSKASNYDYAFSSIFQFLCGGHLRKANNKKPTNFICSGLALAMLREPIFITDPRIQLVANKYKDIEANSVTPLDLYLSMADAGYSYYEV